MCYTSEYYLQLFNYTHLCFLYMTHVTLTLQKFPSTSKNYIRCFVNIASTQWRHFPEKYLLLLEKLIAFCCFPPLRQRFFAAGLCCGIESLKLLRFCCFTFIIFTFFAIQAWMITHLLWFLNAFCWNLFSPSIIARNVPAFLVVANCFGYFLSIFTYIKGREKIMLCFC